MSGSRPLPMNRPEISVAHALAGQYLGMKLIYLEAGSGAESAVPDETILAVEKNIDIPLIVGGGIRKPEEAAQKVKSGASFIVTGTAVESGGGGELLKSFSDAIHGA